MEYQSSRLPGSHHGLVLEDLLLILEEQETVMTTKGENKYCTLQMYSEVFFFSVKLIMRGRGGGGGYLVLVSGGHRTFRCQCLCCPSSREGPKQTLYGRAAIESSNIQQNVLCRHEEQWLSSERHHWEIEYITPSLLPFPNLNHSSQIPGTNQTEHSWLLLKIYATKAPWIQSCRLVEIIWLSSPTMETLVFGVVAHLLSWLPHSALWRNTQFLQRWKEQKNCLSGVKGLSPSSLSPTMAHQPWMTRLCETWWHKQAPLAKST